MGWFTKKPDIKENNLGLGDLFMSFVGLGGRTAGYKECRNMSMYEYVAYRRSVSVEQIRSEVAIWQTKHEKYKQYKDAKRSIQGIRRTIRECPKRSLSKEVKDKMKEYDEFLKEKIEWLDKNVGEREFHPARILDSEYPIRFAISDEPVLSPEPSTPELDELKVELQKIRSFVESVSEKPLLEKQAIAEKRWQEEEIASKDKKNRRSRWTLVNPVAIGYAKNLLLPEPVINEERAEELAQELTHVKELVAQTRAELETIFKSEYIDTQVKLVVFKDVSDDAKVNARQLQKHIEYLKALCQLFPQ